MNRVEVLETDSDNCPEFDSWRKAGMTPIRVSGPVMSFGRKPTFKNIRTLTEQEVEALKVKSETKKN